MYYQYYSYISDWNHATFLSHTKQSGQQLLQEQVDFYQKHQFYKYKCPTASIWEKIYGQNLAETFQEQSEVFWTHQNQLQVDQTLDKLLDILTSTDITKFQHFTFYSKSLFLVIMNFLLAATMIVFRLLKKSEQMKKGLPRILSLFWLFCALQMFFQLQLSTADLENDFMLLILNWGLLIMICSYFFCLVLRLQDLFEVQQEIVVEEGIQKLGKNSSKEVSVIAVFPFQFDNAIEIYHFIVLLFILSVNALKMLLSREEMLFMRMTNAALAINGVELFPFSPRITGFFTVSFLAFSQFSGKKDVDLLQYQFLKIAPFIIILLDSFLSLHARNLIVIWEDIYTIVLFTTSFACYMMYESPFSKRVQEIWRRAEERERTIALQKKQQERNKALYEKIKQSYSLDEEWEEEGSEQEDYGSEDLNMVDGSYSDDQQVVQYIKKRMRKEGKDRRKR